MKKPVTVKIPKCKKCKGRLEPRVTTELEEGETKKPKFLIVYGFCKKCKFIHFLDLIETKDLPDRKDLIKSLKKLK